MSDERSRANWSNEQWERYYQEKNAEATHNVFLRTDRQRLNALLTFDPDSEFVINRLTRYDFTTKEIAAQAREEIGVTDEVIGELGVGDIKATYFKTAKPGVAYFASTHPDEPTRNIQEYLCVGRITQEIDPNNPMLPVYRAVGSYTPR